MPLFPPPLPEPIPFDEVAEVLSDAARRVSGGPAALIGASGRHLATALDAAGCRVVRLAPPDAQLTL